MADRMVKECDVFKTTKDVKTYEVTIRDTGVILPGVHAFRENVDLSMRAYFRLKRFMLRGITPTPGTIAKLSKDDPKNFHANVEDETPALV